MRAIWIKEFAAALTRQTRALGWLPTMSLTGLLRRVESEAVWPDPQLQLRHFPLQRGFARGPRELQAISARQIVARLERLTADPASSPVICTTPHYASFAEMWPGPVVYYVTDAFAFPGYTDDPTRVRALDVRMCGRADLVCPNSKRIAEYLMTEAGCPEDKIAIIPNATRQANILPEPALTPADLPFDAADLRRPVAGIIGNLAANMDWVLLHAAIERTPWLSWLFVGPTEMPVLDSQQRAARDALLQSGGRVRFVGSKAYGELRDYGRAFDVAILPYRKCEPTFSGSSTRFYEHLAACRPMLATRGFEELTHKEPLLRLVDTAEQMAESLLLLRSLNFRDGYEPERWRASQGCTWEVRAEAVIQALSARVSMHSGRCA